MPNKTKLLTVLGLSLPFDLLLPFLFIGFSSGCLYSHCFTYF